MIRLLITGARSYVGVSFEERVRRLYSDEIAVDTLDMENASWREADFSGYDVVFHVAGIAHVDLKKNSAEQEKLYFSVNTDLAAETAKKAKAEGVGQFIFMSSAIVYGDAAPIGKEKIITADTEPSPKNCYGESKLRAERALTALRDGSFKVVILRPPMIYGRGCKGNYQSLRSLALKLPVFPRVKNERSMIYIESFCEFVRLMVVNGEDGLFLPQNGEYSNTSEMVEEIARLNGKKVRVVRGFTPALKLLGRLSPLANKAFGNLTYDKAVSEYKDEYRVCTLGESLAEIEKQR